MNVRMRPFSVVAHAEIPEGGAEGVLIAQGGRFAGWSFFVQQGKLVYEHNYVGLERYRVISNIAIPAGKVTLGMEFTITGQFEITPELTAMGVQGVNGQATLYINDKPAGSGRHRQDGALRLVVERRGPVLRLRQRDTGQRPVRSRPSASPAS